VIKLNQDPEVLAKSVMSGLTNAYKGKILMEIPLMDENVISSEHRSDVEEEDERVDSQWLRWHKFHKATDYNTKFEVSFLHLTFLNSC
jgi:hypothetical protein